MHTYLRNRPAWVQLVIFAGLIGGGMILYIVGVTIIARFNNLSVTSFTPENFARPEMAAVAKQLLIVQFIGIFFFPPLVFSYLADPQPLQYAGIRSPQKGYFILLGIVTMIAAFFMVEWMAALNEEVVMRFLSKAQRAWVEKGETETDDMLKNILTMKRPADLIYSLFLVAFLPAIGEELFFRGILQRLFIQIFRGPWPGIVFTAALFSAFHGQFMGFLPRMVLGIVLGSLYWYSGSIFTSMLGHFVYNGINILLIYNNTAEVESKSVLNSTSMLIGLVSLAIVTFLIFYLRKKSTTSYALVYLPPDEYDIFKNGDKNV